MHRSEIESTPCAVCGASVDAGESRAYAFGTQAVLCFECAIGRGGSYDADTEQWVAVPRVSDLAWEER